MTRHSNAKQMRDWRQRNPEASRAIHARWRRKKKQQALDAYGGKCACCGESHEVFLTIDHIEGNGADERRAQGHRGGIYTYRFLAKMDFPPGYQVLCWNCNLAKGILGLCPHEARR